MSITKILNAKDADPSEQLEQVAEIVSAARQAYGNVDAEIKSPMVNTTHGAMGFDMLEDDSKINGLRQEILSIKAEAVEFAARNEGGNINKKIEELLATNPLFTNIGSSVEFAYI